MIIRQPLFSAGEVVLFLCLFLSFLMTIYKRNTLCKGWAGFGLFSEKTQKTALLYIATTRQPPLPSFALLCHGLPA